MSKRGTLAIAMLVGMILAGAAWAEPVTLEGKVLCAKCSLHEEGRDECQNVLVVERDGKSEQYYIVKNETYAKLGDVCQGTKPVRIKGEVQQKEGRQWIAATEITAIEAKKG